MLKLEAIKKDAQLTGLDPNGIVRVVSVEPVGTDAVTVFYKTADGKPAEQMPSISSAASGAPRALARPCCATSSSPSTRPRIGTTPRLASTTSRPRSPTTGRSART